MPELEYFDHDCNNYQRLSITSTCQVVDDPNRPMFSAWVGEPPTSCLHAETALHRGRHRERWEHTAQRGADCRKLVCDSFLPYQEIRKSPFHVVFLCILYPRSRALGQNPCTIWGHWIGDTSKGWDDFHRKRETTNVSDARKIMFSRTTSTIWWPRSAFCALWNYLLCILLYVKNYSTHTYYVYIYIIYVNMHVSIHDFGSYLILGIFIPFTLRYMLRLFEDVSHRSHAHDTT